MIVRALVLFSVLIVLLNARPPDAAGPPRLTIHVIDADTKPPVPRDQGRVS